MPHLEPECTKCIRICRTIPRESDNGGTLSIRLKMYECRVHTADLSLVSDSLSRTNVTLSMDI